MSRSEGLNRLILAIAWPAIVSNITTPLLGLVDTAIAGHLGSSAALGAIALGSTVFNLIYWLFGFLRMSAAGITSQAYGAGDRLEQSSSLSRGMAMAFVLSCLILVLSPVIGTAGLRLLDADDASAPLASLYFRILVWGAPAVLGMYVLNGWLIGMQNTRLPMIIALLANILNIAASALFVFVFGFQIEGIALGTLISQWISFIVCALSIFRIYRPVVRFAGRIKFSRMLSLNADIFLRTLCMVAVTTWFTRTGASQGVEILAANAILMQFFLLFSYFSDGFAYSGEALAGKFYGAGDNAMLAKLSSRLLVWGGGVAVVFSLAYFLGGELLLKILTDRHEVIETAREYLPWAVSVPFCGFAAFIYDGIFVGLTRTRQMLVSVVIGMGMYFSLYFALYGLIGNHSLWIAFIVYLAVRGLSLHIIFKKYK